MRFESLTTSFDKQEISLLDPLETLKTLKQIIRLFYFAKTKKQKLDMNFFIDEENTTLSYLIKNLLNIELINSQVSFGINNKTQNSRSLKKKKFFQLNFILDKQLSKDKNFMKKQFYKGNFLFVKVNSQIEKTQNSYKIHNNFEDYKKALFFISFLKQILLKQYSIKRHEIQKKV